jgi:SSS family solute:Na+ symporter
MTVHVAIVIGLVIYVVLTTVVSFVMMARVRRPTDYLVAGRGLPFWVLMGTIVGTCIGTGVIIGGSGLAYQHGWAGCAYPIGLGLGTLLTGLFFAGMRKYKFMTLSEEVACYYDGSRAIVEFSQITIFLSQLCWLTVQIIGGAAVLGEVTGLDPKLCVLMAGFAKAAISIPGGIKAVVYTDVLQTIILFFGFSFLVHSALVNSGGLAGLEQSVPPQYVSFLGVDSYGGWNVAALIITLIGAVIADPGRRLTMYSAQTEGGAKWSMVFSGAVVIVFSIAIGITGMYTFKLNPHLHMPDQKDHTLPWLVMHSLPPWLAAFVVASTVSGMSSAANATAASAGTFFVRHLFPLVTGRYPAQPVAAVRWALVGVFLFSTMLGLFTKSVVDFVTKFLPLTMSGLAVTILFGRFWSRVTWQGGLTALIVTPLVSLIAMSFFSNPTLLAMAAGAFALIIVSLLTPPRRRSIEEVAEIMARERQSIEGKIGHGAEAPATTSNPTLTKQH